MVAYRRQTVGVAVDEMQQVGVPLYACTRRERVMGWLRHDMQLMAALRQRERVRVGAECGEGGQWQGLAWG
jgi:hypothetical protein